MSFERQRMEIIEICKRLWQEQEIDCILAFKEGGVDGMSTPFFIKNCDELEIEKIKWDQRCVQNLASYLQGRKGKTAIVAKPCDTRAIVNYIMERQIERENIYIIGVDCVGMRDFKGDLLPGCAECRVHKPTVYDAYVQNDEIPQDLVKSTVDAENNLARFHKEMEKCILCYSCRQACYGCYCQVCFMDRGVPDWEAGEIDMGRKMTYHLGRAMHLAGRCVECGACERVCASGVNTRYLIKEVTDFVEELYGYRTGMDLETTPAMTDFKTDDRQVGFIGGEVHG